MSIYEDLAFTLLATPASGYRECSECGDEWPTFQLRNGFCRACIEMMEPTEAQRDAEGRRESAQEQRESRMRSIYFS